MLPFSQNPLSFAYSSVHAFPLILFTSQASALLWLSAQGHTWRSVGLFLLELQQSPLQAQIQFDNVCLSHSLFSDEELKKLGGLLPSIYTTLYSTVLTTLHPSRSIISILSFTLFPFLTGPLNQAWGPMPLLSHAFFLPKFWPCSSAPLRAPQPLYSSIVASRKTFISHLFL